MEPVKALAPQDLQSLEDEPRAKVMVELRRRFWPILSMGPEILWARQFGVACGFSAQDPDRNLLWIWEERCLTGESPSAQPAS